MNIYKITQNPYLILCLLFFALSSISSCKKKEKEPDLPPITCEGANTFGCKVNGKIIETSGRTEGFVWSLDDYVEISTSTNEKKIYIKAIRKNLWEFLIYLNYRNDDFIDNYTLISNLDYTQNYAEYITYKDNGIQLKKFSSHSNHPANVLITYYGLNNRTGKWAIAGTFDMTMISAFDEKIRIANGRFDISL